MKACCKRTDNMQYLKLEHKNNESERETGSSNKRNQIIHLGPTGVQRSMKDRAGEKKY